MLQFDFVDATPQAARGAEQPNGERPRVLIVDDEKFIRDLLADFLGMDGYAVRTAEDGAAALTELHNTGYDIVISDLKDAPDGRHRAPRADPAPQRPTRITVIMTGFGTVETAIDAMKRGAYDYILKPFKVEEVIHVVQRGLSRKQRLAAEGTSGLKEAVSLYKVSEAIQASLSLEQVITTISDTALHELGADWVSTWLDDGQGGYFERQHIATASEASAAQLPPDVGALDPAAFIAYFKDSSALLEHGPPLERFFAKRPSVPPQSLVAVPLRSNRKGSGSLLGWICALAFAKNKRFDEGQRKVLAIVGSRAAAAIDNARLYEDLQATFQQTIEGLAKAIDKMDRYTAGHSSRVALYAVFIAQKLGLPPHDQEIVRQSALMHDIGKIGCVLNLNKPGKLTQDEYEIFKKHPGFGKDILDPASSSCTPSFPACLPSRALGRARIPARARGQRRAADGAHHRGGRHVRRHDERPRLSRRASARGGRRRD